MQSAKLLTFLSKHKKHRVNEIEKLAEEEQPGDLQHFADLLVVYFLTPMATYEAIKIDLIIKIFIKVLIVLQV